MGDLSDNTHSSSSTARSDDISNDGSTSVRSTKQKQDLRSVSAEDAGLESSVPAEWTNEMVDMVISGMNRDKGCTNLKFKGLENAAGRRNEHANKFEAPHTPSDYEITDRPFICMLDDCHRAFKRLEHLRRHHRIHTGERPFCCNYPGCYKSFARSDNLTQHLKVHNANRVYKIESPLDFMKRDF